jgi:parallel beta-helix repeat protein
MRKQFTSLIILSVIILGFLNFTLHILPAARATPVQGVISQDTLWTLVDSPFIVTNDIIINANVTLTVEPGVQVRFGGPFSMFVFGRIVAQGTTISPIVFTTNDPNGTNYWNTISIYGQQSSFTNCVIEYATNATVLKAGSLQMQNVRVQNNSESGIVVDAGTITVDSSTITLNQESGVVIEGASTVTVTNNVIDSSTYGITLSGMLTGSVQIQQNEISNNTQAGIFINALALTNTQINGNNVTANQNGFLISTSTTTRISNNFIFANGIGVSYTGDGFHQLNFNDIYDNAMGAQVTSSNANVNAIHNYWGDRSGPQNEWLNPHGKGNPISENGSDLNVLPFLTRSFTSGSSPPTAVLWSDVATAAPSETVTLVGTGSYAQGSVVDYYYDFNDGTNSGHTTLSLFNHTYSTPGIYQPTLIVWDDFGWWSTTVSTTVTVVNSPVLQTSLTINNPTIAYNGNTWISVYVSTGTGAAAGATVSLFSTAGGSFSPQTGTTDANGNFAAQFTAPNASQTTEARIIARASMNGYADGSAHDYVKVIPPLTVTAVPASPTVNSGDNVALNVYVLGDFAEPVENATVTVSADYGMITPTTQLTESNGTGTFTYSAPTTLTQLTATFTITASKTEYADGQISAQIIVQPKILSVSLSANPSTVPSQEPTTITAQVTFNSIAVQNATVSVSSDTGGNFSETQLETDSGGIARFAFTAPETVQIGGVNTTITATVSKDGFIGNQGQLVLSVTPKTLDVQVVPQALTTLSGTNMSISVVVGYEGKPLSNANVTIAAANGTFAPTLAITDSNGNATFNFTAPEFNEDTNLTISVLATKEGYVENTDSVDITVQPQHFRIQPSPSDVHAGQTETITISVRSNDTTVATPNALVTIALNNGQKYTNVTGLDGTCTFTVRVPQTSESTMNMTVTVSREGYVGREVVFTLNVIPAQAGFPWLTLLIIAIPVVVVIIVVVLIKMKVIVVSNKDDEGSE